MRIQERTHRRQLLVVWLAMTMIVSLFPIGGAAEHATPATSVALAGNVQSELGCPGDWQPECDLTELAVDDAPVWKATFSIPAGGWEYKVALDDTWDVSYPGPNIGLSLTASTDVSFYYSDRDHWVQDSVNNRILTAVGNFQSELGCADDWQPWCITSLMDDTDGDGVYTYVTDQIPAGSYEGKVAADEDWVTSYPAGNVAFTVADGDTVTFSYDSATDAVSITAEGGTAAGSPVALVGSLQSELGCPDDWQPDCSETELPLADGDVYRKTFDLPAGDYEYKVALNDSWDENYGAGAEPNGLNIPLSLAADTAVTFYFSDTTNLITDNVNDRIVTAAGSFQSELGCGDDWQPWCLISWMQDVDGDDVYTFVTDQIPAGDYEAKAAIGEAWDESYPNDNVAFTVTDGATVTFSFDSPTNTFTVEVDGPSGDFSYDIEPGDEALVGTPARPPVDETIYFVMPDRFANGDTSNDDGGVSGDRLANGTDPTSKAFYHGGDLAGLTSQLDYLDGLGVTAVWMTPMFRNDWVQGEGTQFVSAGYHGYWQTDYSQIDPHFGTNAEMQAFIDAAQARGIKVFFDIVANHTGDLISYAEGTDAYISKDDQPYRDASGVEFDDRDFAGTGTFPDLDPAVSFPYTPVVNGDKFPDWLDDPIYYHNRGNSSFTGENSLYGDFFGLDDLFTEHPVVQDGLIDIFKSMITDFGVDGFRIDTVKHVNDEFWEAFVAEIDAHAAAEGKSEFFYFGEVFDGDPGFLSRFTTELDLPGVLDFGFHGAALGFAANSNAATGLQSFFAGDDWFTDEDSSAHGLPNFIGNHDVGRFGFFIDQANPGASDAERVARAELGYALMFTSRGMPVIYYGDEQGFVGDGGDQDARQDMFPSQVDSYNDDDLIGTSATTADSNFDDTHPLYQTLADLAALRDANPVLQTGAQIERYAAGSVYAFSRIEGSEYLVVLNNAETEASVSIPVSTVGTFTEIWPGAEAFTSDGSVDVTVPALSARVFAADVPVAAPASGPGVAATGPTGEVTGRVPVTADVDGPDYSQVTFLVSVDGSSFEPLGTDDNAPYRVYHDVSELPVGASLVYKAIVSDLAGGLASDTTAAAVGEEVEPPPPSGDARYAIVHYQRSDGDYGDHTTGNFNDFWGLHLWGDAIAPSEVTDWPNPKPFLGEDEYGRFAWIELQDASQPVNFIVHRGDTKDGTDADRSFDPGVSPEIWLKQDDGNFYTSQAAAQGYVTIHYQRPDGDYGDPSSDDFNDFWGLHLWGDAIDPSEGTEWTSPKKPTGTDDYGIFWEIAVQDVNQTVNFIIHRGDTKDPGPDQFMTPADDASIFIQSGDEAIYASRGAAEDFATIHYHRPDGDYGDYTSTDFNDFWGLHIWEGAASPNPSWQQPVKPVGFDTFGPIFEIPVIDGAPQLAYIIHRGDTKDPGPDQFLEFATYGYEVWQLQGADPEAPYILPLLGGGPVSRGDLGQQQAYWVDADTLVWDVEAAAANLCWSATAAIALSDSGVDGADACLPLSPDGTFSMASMEPSVREGFDHLVGLPAWTVSVESLEQAEEIATSQHVVVASTDDVRVDATGIQIPGVLDDVYATDAPLGVTWDGDVPTVSVWAPTAQSVKLHRFETSTSDAAEILDMTRTDGVWSITGDASWKNQFYLFEIDVYVPSTQRIETNIVTDPYSVSLSTNSKRSQIVDLADPALAPDGWDGVGTPAVDSFEDISIYELHVRDFSVMDPEVPDELVGTFAAFTVEDSVGMQHLAQLADAGITDVHLLPAFDIATIDEDKSNWQSPDFAELGALPPDSEEQQAAVTATKDLDAFNWGYDPFHYTVPEGSYSTDPDGTQRIVEFREMVQSLNGTGLRVVMDVVYNHTNGGGQAEKSVLDKVVPGYYHRLNDSGAIETSTCCANTATEHQMMGRLMIDSVVTWAKEYKVDGFRFDLMGHHTKANMLDLRAALDELTLADDGVDGSQIYLYGEGWNFGEVANDARFTQATQLNMAGTGIGTFSDRLRDAVRGGGPFDDGEALRINQGFINGLWYDPNEVALPEDQALDRLLLAGDQIRVGLAGNLAGYEFVDSNGNLVTGADIDYNGSPAGYTADPQENIVYVSAHDNQTLFDIGQYHHPLDTSMADRVRAQNLGVDITALAQGVSFFHAGVEMLRSKSLDRDSFNSGDWFNRLDFTFDTSGWGAGLPVAEKNESNWPIIGPLLAGLDAPSSADMQATFEHAKEILEIRTSSELFSLDTAADVQERVGFHNTGPSQIPGLIVMSIDDTVGDDLDPEADGMWVLINAGDEPITFDIDELADADVILHPVQRTSTDAVVRVSSFAAGTFTVPARTTAVFVELAPDVTPPTIDASLVFISGHAVRGQYQVSVTCTDDRGDATVTSIDINGFDVVDGQRVTLFIAGGPTRARTIRGQLWIWSRSFELNATCVDEAGNVATVTVPLRYVPRRAN